MLLDVVEPLFLEEADGRLVVGRGVDDDHPHPLLPHAAFYFLEQPIPHSAFLNPRAHSQPDKVTVLPGGVVFFHGRTEGEAEDLPTGFRHQAELTVRIEESGDLVLVPGTVEALRVLGGKDLFADVEDLREIVGKLQDGVVGYYSNEYAVLADGSIHNVEDLKGKVLATNGLGSGVDIGMRAMANTVSKLTVTTP